MNGKVRIDGLNQPDGSQCPKGPFSSKNTVLSQLQFSFISLMEKRSVSAVALMRILLGIPWNW
jgi:hypothetical protein